MKGGISLSGNPLPVPDRYVEMHAHTDGDLRFPQRQIPCDKTRVTNEAFGHQYTRCGSDDDFEASISEFAGLWAPDDRHYLDGRGFSNQRSPRGG